MYEPVAEGVLFYDGTVPTQNVQEGQSWSTRFGFVNVSDKEFNDPLKVELEVVTQETQHRLATDSLIRAPLPGQTTYFNVYSKTVGKAGINDVNVYVNRREVSEQYYDNNFANLPGYLIVQPDKTNPALDVTIDGRNIRNGEFVSSNPLIQLTVKDENPFMLITDPKNIKIFLRYPCNCDPLIPILNNDSVKWYPATITTDFRVDFTPINLMDGEYVLSVEASDVSGNLSGADPYEISFNVKSETTLNFNGVYPNPSSIGFFFNFELSGNILPEEFLLEVFSPAGQLVTRFGIEDVQRFYIGTNEIIWNGMDTTGKLLTNGVYLYRLRIKTGEIDSINTGKLVWLR